MSDRTNTIFGWVLFAGIVVMGLRFISTLVYHGEEVTEPGYLIVGAETEGGEAEMTMAEAVSGSEMPMEEMVSKGEQVFAKCVSCHTVNAGGANGIGPNLHGIMGKPIGTSVAGFAYSSALAEKGGNWDWDTMNAWLKSPRAFANGTKMSFAGLSKIEDRAAVAVYMNSQGPGISLPEYVEAVADEAESEETVDASTDVGEVEAAGALATEEPIAENPGDQ